MNIYWCEILKDYVFQGVFDDDKSASHALYATCLQGVYILAWYQCFDDKLELVVEIK